MTAPCPPSCESEDSGGILAEALRAKEVEGFGMFWDVLGCFGMVWGLRWLLAADWLATEMPFGGAKRVGWQISQLCGENPALSRLVPSARRDLDMCSDLCRSR